MSLKMNIETYSNRNINSTFTAQSTLWQKPWLFSLHVIRQWIFLYRNINIITLPRKMSFIFQLVACSIGLHCKCITLNMNLFSQTEGQVNIIFYGKLNHVTDAFMINYEIWLILNPKRSFKSKLGVCGFCPLTGSLLECNQRQLESSVKWILLERWWIPRAHKLELYWLWVN